MKLRSTFFLIFCIICCLFLSLIIFLIFILEPKFYDNIETLWIVISNILIIILSIFISFDNFILLEVNGFILRFCGRKYKIRYCDVKKIFSSYQFGCYWIIANNNRQFFITMPFAHKSLKILFDIILDMNPKVEIDVRWYKKIK